MSKVTDLKDWSRRNNIWCILTTSNIYHLLFWISPNKFYDNILFWESCFHHYQNFTIYILAFELSDAFLDFNRFIVFKYRLFCNLVLSFFLILRKSLLLIFLNRFNYFMQNTPNDIWISFFVYTRFQILVGFKSI